VRTFLVALLVLAGAAVAGDRVAEHLAAGEAESRLAAQGLADPHVEVGGFPFLTQLAAREFSDVRVTASSLDVEQGTARDVDVTARGVAAPSGGDVTLAEVEGRGLVTYDEVVARAGVPDLRMRPGDSPDTVRMTTTVQVLGEPVDVVATSRVRASGRTVRVTPRSFELADGSSVGGSLTRSLGERLTVVYPLRDLPEGVEVRGVRATAGGFEVTVRGRDVVLSDLG
jgi:hypothetical protein